MSETNNTNSKINREFFEYYAKYSLIMSYRRDYRKLKKGESPDWHSSSLDTGVEVTRAINKDIYLAYNIINEYFGNVFVKDNIAEQIIDRERERSESAKAAGISIIDYSDISNINNLKKRYIYKTEKLNKNYIHFSENHLYMFTFKSMSEDEVKQCFDIDLAKYKMNFDICFINCFDRLYICDFVNRAVLYSVNERPETLNLIKKKALKKSRLI
ncbi:MAG: hypothetical protein JXN65_07305 [Clostridia bacterium]|nr:hypothetical protein [Clostridia bacterium]